MIDGLIGIIPILGDVLDALFKANLRNLAILEVSFVCSHPIYVWQETCGGLKKKELELVTGLATQRRP